MNTGSVLNFGSFQSYQSNQMQQQMQIKKQDMVEMVVETQLTLNQLQNSFDVLDIFCRKLFNNQLKNQNDVINCNSFAVGSINVFGSMCNDLIESNNKRALDLCSYKLETYIKNAEKNRNKNELQFLAPFLKYIHCAVNGNNVKILPSIKLNQNEWNNNSVNNFMSNYLGSQHTVDDNIANIKKNAKQLNMKYDQIWKERNQKPANLGKPQEVTWKDVYAVSNVSEKDIEFDALQPYMSVQDENEMFGVDFNDNNNNNNHCYDRNHVHSMNKHYKNNNIKNNNNNNKQKSKKSKRFGRK